MEWNRQSATKRGSTLLFVALTTLEAGRNNEDDYKVLVDKACVGNYEKMNELTIENERINHPL
jgi:hypothetical protein